MIETMIAKRLYEASIQAGVVALAMQKDIVNEGKAVEQEEHEDAHHLAMRQAKTKVDVMVQDMLLMALRDVRLEVSLDVEEDSEYLSMFPNEKAPYSLVIDPIDGTLDYLNQLDTYSICSAIIKDGDMQAVVVYFPRRDTLYCYEPLLGARYFKQAHLSCWEDGVNIDFEGDETRLVYKNHRVDEKLLDRFVKHGCEVVDDRISNCPEALLACMKKEALCYVSATRNIRDILMGAILSKCEDGALLDETGEIVLWPSHGRLPMGIFTRFPEKVKKILK